MKIVVLDGYTLDPGDLSWSELEAVGACAIHDRTPPNQTVERARRVNKPLLTTRNFMITPHIARATRPGLERRLKFTVDNLEAFLECRPVKVVNS